MSFDYAETNQFKNVSIQRRLPDNDFDGDNDCTYMEIEEDNSSDIDHDIFALCLQNSLCLFVCLLYLILV